MKTKYGLGLFLLVVLGSGCSMHWDRTKVLTSRPYVAGIGHHDVRAAAVFEEVIPGKALPETVWDNDGPFWDQKYSQRIGFIQHYTDYFFYTEIETRFMLPFGRIFSDVMTSAISNACPSVRVAYHPADAQPLTAGDKAADIQIIIKINRFSVSEEPLNHMNYSLGCHYQVIDRTKNVSHDYDLTRKAGPIPIGFTTHSAAVDEIDRQVRMMAEDATTEILKNCFP